MRVMRVLCHGPPRSLQGAEIDIPVPSDNQLLIAVKCAGVNPVDTYIR